MKLNILFFLITNFIVAQSNDNLFTLVTKLNSSPNFGPSQNKMGSLNPTSGIVSEISSTFTEMSFNISGGAFDSNSRKMYLMTENSTITSFDFISGSIASIPINTSFTGPAIFDNVSYSISDATLYGLLRPFDSNNNSLGVFLAKLNPDKGDVTTISQSSIANGYQLAGTAIDPQLMVYYFKTGPKFLGIDLYNGTIFSQPDVVFNSNDFDFSNFTYNCSDNTIYGIAREMTTIQMPGSPFGVYTQYCRLAKIDPTTGIVVRISETILPNNIYSVNAGSAIDPSSNTFFYSDNSFLYGASLLTGEILINIPITFENGDIVNFISNVDECFGAIPTRLDPNLNVEDFNLNNDFIAYPNPTSYTLTIKTVKDIDLMEVFDSLGRMVLVEKSNNSINVSNLQTGTYLIKIVSGNDIQNIKFIKN